MDSNALKNVDSSQQFVMTICLFSKSGRHLCLDSVEERKACCPGGGRGGGGAWVGGGGGRDEELEGEIVRSLFGKRGESRHTKMLGSKE